MDNKPLHQHNCDQCLFLGTIDNADLYVHKDNDPFFTTVIARYGIDGDYSSGLCFVGRIPLLTKAAKIAYELDIITDHDLAYHGVKINDLFVDNE